MSSMLVRLALVLQILLTDAQKTVPVDFFVFIGKDGDKEKKVAPRTSMNIKPPDDTIGFPALCKDECPVFELDCGTDCTAPQMRWCKCIAELLVKDLVHDFRALLDDGSDAVFSLGEYIEVDKGQDYFDIHHGHDALYALLDTDSSKAYAMRSGRVAVWVANHVAAPDDPNSMLAGTTLLDQPLWKGGRGAGLLLSAQIDRSSKVLSHEVGHIVGFHHTAGPSLMYKYDHPECPKEYQHVEMHPLVFPSCEVNIMGYWYDGPYCCPGAASASFLLQFLGRQSGTASKCLPHSLTDFQEAHCCGSECAHSCPKEMPEPKFDTKEHKDPLSKMLHCWLHLKTIAESKNSPAAVGGYVGMVSVKSAIGHRKPLVECVDYGHRKWGSCTVVQP